MKNGSIGKGVLEDTFLLSTVVSGDMELSSYREDGDRIATVRLDGEDIDIFAPPEIRVSANGSVDGVTVCTISVGNEPVGIRVPFPTSVDVGADFSDGVKIGSVSVNGSATDIYSPSAFFVPEFTCGVKIGTFVFGHVSTDVFVPEQNPGSNVAIRQFPSGGRGNDDPTRTYISVDDGVTMISSDDVNVSSYYDAGYHLATVTINGFDYEIYAPSCNCPCPY